MKVASSDRSGGFVTIEFVLGVAFLMLPVALLVLVLPMWAERQSVARVAASESARAYVSTNNRANGEAAAMQITGNSKIAPGDVRVVLEGNPAVPGSSVRSTVSVKVPMIQIPLLDRSSGGFELSAKHNEIVDLYRSTPK